jgi:ADP-heptose:LPS heptosyltransferase
MTDTRLLVRGVNWLGDAVMTTPALQRLREARPGARITLLTHQKLRDLWAYHPAVDQVLTFEDRESPWSVARRLRPENFDTALILPNSPRSALEAWRAGIPERIGYARPWRNWFLTNAVAPRPGRVEMHKLSDKEVAILIEGRGVAPRRPRPRGSGRNESGTAPDPSPSVPWPDASLGDGDGVARRPYPFSTEAHQMHEYLHLMATLGANSAPLAPKLVVTDDEMRETEKTWLSRLRNEKGFAVAEPVTLLGLNPGAEYGPAKRWPAENFAAVASKISRESKNYAWLVFGGANDRELGDQISSLTEGKAINIAGKTTLREFMALLKMCRVLLTNDTGPMHVAAALGTPVVVPFGSTSPELTGPGLPGDKRNHLIKGEAPCAPCFRRECPIDFRCMKSITVESVADAVLEALSPK